jgi:hypothetical protein
MSKSSTNFPILVFSSLLFRLACLPQYNLYYKCLSFSFSFFDLKRKKDGFRRRCSCMQKPIKLEKEWFGLEEGESKHIYSLSVACFLCPFLPLSRNRLFANGSLFLLNCVFPPLCAL